MKNSPIDDPVLLRAIAEQITKFVIPELQSGDAAERANFAVLALQRIAGRIEVEGPHAAAAVGEYRAALEAVIDQVGRSSTRIDVSAARSDLQAALARSGDAVRLVALRDLAVRIVNALVADDGTWFLDANGREGRLMKDLLTLEIRLRDAYEKAVTAKATGASASAAASPPSMSIHELVTAETVTAYFRSKLPRSSGITAKTVRILPGGRSKYTVFISFEGTEELPSEVVMRQDTGATMIPTTVVDEYPLLKTLAHHDVRTAEPVYLEREMNALGRPFMLVRRLEGKTPGDYFSFAGGNRELVAELATVLGRMHSIDVRSIDVPKQRGRDHVRYLLDEIAYFRAQWLGNALEPSPIITYAFAWLEAECRRSVGGPAVVHGDMGPHNYLVQDGKLTGIVDWEFAHIGDPAEDLAYRRELFEQHMPWEEFLRIYYAAGGAPIDERRLRMFTVWGFIRNAAFGALGHREYKDGTALDFANAALSTFLYGFFDGMVGNALTRPR